jgi:hypothetical protein
MSYSASWVFIFGYFSSEYFYILYDAVLSLYTKFVSSNISMPIGNDGGAG